MHGMRRAVWGLLAGLNQLSLNCTGRLLAATSVRHRARCEWVINGKRGGPHGLHLFVLFALSCFIVVSCRACVFHR